MPHVSFPGCLNPKRNPSGSSLFQSVEGASHAMPYPGCLTIAACANTVTMFDDCATVLSEILCMRVFDFCIVNR